MWRDRYCHNRRASENKGWGNSSATVFEAAVSNVMHNIPVQPITHTAEPPSSDDSEDQLSSLRLKAELARKTSEELLAEAEQWKSRCDRECQRLQGWYNSHNVCRREKRMDEQLAEKHRLLCGLKKELKVASHQAAKKSTIKAAYYKK